MEVTEPLLTFSMTVLLLTGSQSDCRLDHLLGMQTLSLHLSMQEKVLLNFKNKGVIASLNLWVFFKSGVL